MKNAAIIIAIVAAFILLPSTLLFTLLVSIVWTHRPDLSVGDILRGIVEEIINWLRCLLSGKEK